MKKKYKIFIICKLLLLIPINIFSQSFLDEDVIFVKNFKTKNFYYYNIFNEKNEFINLYNPDFEIHKVSIAKNNDETLNESNYLKINENDFIVVDLNYLKIFNSEKFIESKFSIDLKYTAKKIVSDEIKYNNFYFRKVSIKSKNFKIYKIKKSFFDKYIRGKNIGINSPEDYIDLILIM